MKSKILILFLSLVLVLGMTSCKITINTGTNSESSSTDDSSQSISELDSSEISEPQSSEPEISSELEISSEPVNVSSSDIGEPPLPQDWDPVVMQRQVLLDDNSMCGVAYLGYVKYDANDLEKDRDYYTSLLKQRGFWDTYDFLHDMPSDRLAGTTNGTELYLVMPYDQDAKVMVNLWKIDESNDYMGEVDGILNSFDNGAPFLLKCNASDIMPDTQVVILDSDNQKLEWIPRISLRDGSVETSANGKYVTDFTQYD